MIQELSNKVWANGAFHDAARRIELSWLRRELRVAGASEAAPEDASRLMRAAAILACSDEEAHRRSAYRVATCAYELFGSDEQPLDQGLRVVLARLGNFPSFSTRRDVDDALQRLPLPLAAEEISSADGRVISVYQQQHYLTDFQHKLWSSVKSNKNVALSAPTSAGKSFVLENYLISRFAPRSPQVVMYLVPTRALIAQVSNDLAGQLKKMEGPKPEIFTLAIDPEKELPTQAIYILTQERAQIALNSHSAFRANVIVIDEAHTIADGSRGVLLQWVVDDLLHRNPQTQVLFASPIIRNLNLFGRLFGLSNVVELSSTEQTVSQNFLIVNVSSATKGQISVESIGDGAMPATEVARLSVGQTIASRVDKLTHVSAALGRGQSNIIYANGPADTEKIALQLIDLFSEREPTEERLALAELAREAVHPRYVLAECVKKGIAFHYSNMPTQLRRAIENAVSSGLVDFLVCTSTLLQGVNLPAKNIFMCAPEKGRTRPLEATDFWNLSGRAGRLRREFQGNIFLIDYKNWKKKPLEDERDAIVVPAIATSIREQHTQLIDVISDRNIERARKDTTLETTFVRLYSDLKRGELATTLERIGLAADAPQATDLSSALTEADDRVTIPADIIRRTPNVSAHKQQRLFERLKRRVDRGGEEAARLVPRHPRESEAFQSYADILEMCHEIILGFDTAKNFHRFIAVIALKWMQGIPLPQIIEDQIKRRPGTNLQTTIRDSLELIEDQIRFQAVRLFGCYNTLLIYALGMAGLMELASSVPALPLYLEVGASDRTMISFVSLGLSRVTAMKLNELSARKDLDVPAALQWLRSRAPETLGLSPLLLAEVEALISSQVA